MRQRSNLIILFGVAFFLVGGAIVFLILNGDDDGGGGSSDGVAQVSILVAADDIAPNTVGTDVIESGLLTTKEVPAGSQPVGALTSAAGLENQIFAVGVAKGDPINSAQLTLRSLSNVQVPEGFDGVAITIDYTQGGAGYIAPGDTVNLYGLFGAAGPGDAGVTSEGGGNPNAVPRTELALTNVLVLDVSAQQGTSTETVDANGQPVVGRPIIDAPLTYLLALKPADVERVVQLSVYADLYLSLTADGAPPVGDTPGISGDNVNGPVSAASAAPAS